MRVLITGAGGFIGRHLTARQLQLGHCVTAVDIHTDTLLAHQDKPGLQILTGDFRDQELLDNKLKGHDVVFHLASAHLETGVGDDYFWAVNVQGTEEFVRRCHQAGAGRFVHCSSVGVYGNIEHPPADEDSPCHPDIPYEKSKLAGEQAVIAYATEHDFPLAVIRPAWVYGPECPRTEKLFRTIRKGRFFFVGNGQTLRHPIYIDDMVAGFEVAATHEAAPGQVFIMAGPKAVTLTELVAEIARCEDVPPPKLHLPQAPVWAGCYFLETVYNLFGREAPFSRRSLKFFSNNTAFSIQKANRLLAYSATTSLQEGLELTYSWINRST